MMFCAAAAFWLTAGHFAQHRGVAPARKWIDLQDLRYMLPVSPGSPIGCTPSAHATAGGKEWHYAPFCAVRNQLLCWHMCSFVIMSVAMSAVLS